MPSLRILVAEDDKLSATLLKALLESEGHSVCAIASSGAQAVQAARELSPDAVIMDIYLSDEMSGVDAARIIVQQLFIPTMFITGTTDKVLLGQVVDSGALGLIKKPVSADELRVNLRLLLHHQRISAGLREHGRRYETLFRHAPLPMYVCDDAGVLLQGNLALATLLGYQDVEELHAAVDSVACVYAPAEHAQLRSRYCVEQIPAVYERRVMLRHADGSDVSVFEHGVCRVDTPVEGIRYQAVFVPVCGTDNRCALPELDILRKTLDAIPDMVLIMGLDRSVLAANKAFLRHVGATDASEVDSAHFPFVAPNAQCGGECPFSRFLADHREHSGWVQLTENGPQYYNTVSPLVVADGTLLGCVQVFRRMPMRA